MRGIRQFPIRRRILALFLALSFLLCALPAAAEDTLSVGSGGIAVVEVKERLQALGYIGRGNLTGQFTEKTAESVRQFQRVNGLEVTGAVDEITRAVLFSASALKNPPPTVPPPPTPAPTPRWDAPERDAEGFLAHEGEYFYENDEAGLWICLTPSLQVTITRREDPSIPLIWFETEILTRPGECFRAAVSDPDHLWRGFRYPYEFSRDEGFILAFSDDFFGDRVEKGYTTGIIIRNSRILSAATYRERGHRLPNLDMMAQYADGTLKVFACGEISAEDLIGSGAVNVYSFGPILIRDGQIEEMLYDSYYRSLEPRQALGMIAPGHYLLISVQGRRRDSVGTALQRVAEIMLAKGVTQALNLDGGNTMALIFRGRMLNKLANYKNKEFVRTVTSIIGIGHTENQAD